LRVILEGYHQADSLQDHVGVALATLTIAVRKIESIAALAFAVCSLRMLLPDLEVNASLGVVLLPTELRIERVGAVREAENALVHVNHLLLLLPCPIDVYAQGRSASKGPMVLVQVKHWEVVLSLLHKEVVIAYVYFGAEIGFLSVFFIGPTHDLYAGLVILRGHDA
jgi:hypothetical protein